MALAEVEQEHALALRRPRLPGRPIDWNARRRHANEALRAANRALGTAYHPCDLATGAAREPAVVEADLKAAFGEIHSIAGHAALPEPRWTTLRKAEAALTTIHNYDTLRDDGSTPASRFFGQPHGDLFEYLCDHMPDPPHLRKRAPSGRAAGEPAPAQGQMHGPT